MSKASSNFNKEMFSISPDAILEFYEIDFSNLQANFEMMSDLAGINIGADTVYRFCPMKNSSNPVFWQGNAYQPLPIESDGFEQQGDGRLPRPKLAIANPEGLLSKIVHSNHDFANCKVTRKRTFAKFIDDDNFIDPNTKNQDGKNPFGEADPNSHFGDDVYYINRKTSETKNVIQFELVSALELSNAEAPARIVMPNHCGWVYRCSIGCGYRGLPIETVEENSLIFGFNSSSDPNSRARHPGFVDYREYPNGMADVPEWSRFGKNGTENSLQGYNLGDIVRITTANATNPYQQTPLVYVCVQTHVFAKDHHPFFDKHFWQKDECNKTLGACKKRFSSDPIFIQENDYEKYVDIHDDLIKDYNEEEAIRGIKYDNKYDWGKAHWLAHGKSEETRKPMPKIGRVTLRLPGENEASEIESKNYNSADDSGLRFGGFPGTDKHRPA